MTPTADSSKCDAEFVHPNDQNGPLDHHTSQLNTLLNVLQRCPSQLDNIVMLSPIYTLPVEVLSRVFQQLISSTSNPMNAFARYKVCISQAFLLASVSVHFRHVALGTPQLWKRVPLYLKNSKAISKALSLLRHCMGLTTSINVSVLDRLNEEEVHPFIDTLFTPDTTLKIKAFTLFYSFQASNIWIRKLERSSFPTLDFLTIRHVPVPSLDLGAFKAMTRLELKGPCATRLLAIIAPPSLQYLTTSHVQQQILISLLYQSPNLVECSATLPDYVMDAEDAKFDKPLTLSRLKRCSFHHTRATMFSQQLPLMPSLERLDFMPSNRNAMTGVILLCRSVSTTLTTLKLDIPTAMVPWGDLHLFWRISFPNLRKLAIRGYRPILQFIETLTLRVGGCSNTEPHHLPSLTILSLRSRSPAVEPRRILDLLSKWKIDEARYLRVKYRYPGQWLGDWPLPLREELGSIVGRRQIDVVWGYRRVEPLVRGTGDA